MSDRLLLELLRNYLKFQVNMGFRELVIPRPTVQFYPTVQVKSLKAIKEELGECTRCPLHQMRLNIVFGEGNPNADLMFVGEGPGAEEDEQGRPFVGRAGQLLTKMIQAMGLDRSETYICNVVKCRPPENRDPEPFEIQTCKPFLEAQVSAVSPKVIIALGRVAAQTLLGTKESITKLRGRFHVRGKIHVMPTYHPSFLLREEPDKRYKREAWTDLKKVMSFLNLPSLG